MIENNKSGNFAIKTIGLVSYLFTIIKKFNAH